MIYYEKGGQDLCLESAEIEHALRIALEAIEKKNRVLIIPPDITRLHSRAGEITVFCRDILGDKVQTILPALGTHFPMEKEELEVMFPGVPEKMFSVHNWRKDIVTLGHVPSEYIREITEGKLDFDWPAQVNSLLVNGKFDLILSIGQVVPHEVIGMANYNKNIFVGTGGSEGIGKSHFIGACYGMERIMGRTDTPVRKVLNYASKHFASELPVVYIQTVVGLDDDGRLKMRGLFIGDDAECFEKAAELSLKVNFTLLERPLKKVVVHLDEQEFKSTWLGNKSIYRTRMAIDDGGELIVLAPGVKSFGEDPDIDKLIRKYGYHGTSSTLEAVENNKDLAESLGAASHLIHSSSEGRFTITYCTRHLDKSEIENAGYRWLDYNETVKKYNPEVLKEGYNIIDNEEIYYISQPGLGLWSTRERFE